MERPWRHRHGPAGPSGRARVDPKGSPAQRVAGEPDGRAWFRSRRSRGDERSREAQGER